VVTAPLAKIAEILRALPDELLVQAAAGWIAWKLGGEAADTGDWRPPGARAVGVESKKRPTAKLRRELAKKTRKTGGGTVRRETTAAPSGGENVFAALVASPKALLVAELAKKVKASPSATRMALKRLEKNGRVFSAGSDRRTFWAITQDAADEAASA
jgi:ribosomal protein S25